MSQQGMVNISLVITYPPNLMNNYYTYNNNIYSLKNLALIDDLSLRNRIMNDDTKLVIPVSNIINSGLTSKPIEMIIEYPSDNEKHYIWGITTNGSLKILVFDGLYHEIQDYRLVSGKVVRQVPDLSLSESNYQYSSLPRLNLDPHDRYTYSQLLTLNRPESRLRDLSIPIETVNVSTLSNLEINVNPLFQASIETLMKQLYGIPVELPLYLVINGLNVNFVPLEQIGQMLSQNQIERYIIEPLLQPWAGPPGTQNRIITMFGRNGLTYLVKARYGPQSNQLFPPV